MKPALECRNPLLADVGFSADDVRVFGPVAGEVLSEMGLAVEPGEEPLESFARLELMDVAVAALKEKAKFGNPQNLRTLPHVEPTTARKIRRGKENLANQAEWRAALLIEAKLQPQIEEAHSPYPGREETVAFLRSIEGDVEQIKEWNSFRAKYPGWHPVLSLQDSPSDLKDLWLSPSDDADEEDRQLVLDLSRAHLLYADLSGAMLARVNLRGANLHNVRLVNANLARADLRDCYLVQAKLRACWMRGARLEGVDAWEADFTDASLVEAKISAGDFTEANLSNVNVAGIEYDRRQMGGKYRAARIENTYGDPLFRRDALDQQYVDAISYRLRSPWGRLLFWLWGLIDYGRSITRVGFLALLLSFAFGVVFWIDWYLELRLLNFADSANSCLSPFYYSVVTYTTLGFGDITPSHWVGEVLITIEVILGYVTLGLLLAVLANTIARRA